MKCYLCHGEALTTLTTELRHGPGMVVHCAACDLGMLADDGRDLAEYYREEYRRQHGPRPGEGAGYQEIFDAYVGYQGQRVELLRPWLRPETRLVEVGCSTGHFLFNVRGLVREAVGVDYDTGAAAFAASATGCRVFGEGLERAALPAASFDVVCAIQTMEHAADPIEFARALARLLAPGGLLYIEVPGLRDPLLSLYGNDAYRPFYFHRAHRFYFSARSLAETMRRAGLEGRVEFLQDYNFVNHLSWGHTGRPQSTCHEGLGPVRLPLRPDVDEAIRRDLEAWADAAERQYRAILVRHGMTENLGFLGTHRPPR